MRRMWREAGEEQCRLGLFIVWSVMAFPCVMAVYTVWAQ